MSSVNQQILLQIQAQNQAGQALGQVQNQVRQTEKTVTAANQRMSTSTQQLNRNLLQAGAGFAGVASSATAFATSFSVLDKAETAVRSQEAAVEALNVSMARTQTRINKLREEGKTDTEAYTNAVQDLEAKNARLEATQLRLRDAQVQLEDTYTNFIANIAPQMFAMVFGVQNAIRGLGVESIRASLGMFRMNAGARAASIGMRALNFAMGPIGIALIGITTLFTLWATNAFGIRDALNELGAKIQEFLDTHIKPLGDALRWLNENILQPLQEALGITSEEMEKTAEQMPDLKETGEESKTESEKDLDTFKLESENTELRNRLRNLETRLRTQQTTPKQEVDPFAEESKAKFLNKFQLVVRFEDADGVVIGDKTFDVVDRQGEIRLKRRGVDFD